MYCLLIEGIFMISILILLLGRLFCYKGELMSQRWGEKYLFFLIVKAILLT